MQPPPANPGAHRAFLLLVLTCTFSLAGSLAIVSPAGAFLMLVRQGQESADLPQTGDRLGSTVATGDFNNDGYDDLATAAPYENEDIGVTAEHGSVIVNYGSARGITYVDADYLTVGAVTDDDVHYGFALAVGDFNDDGYDDLAVGLPDLDGILFTVADAGEVWIHHGGPNGLSSTPTTIVDHADAGDAIEVGDRFGFSLAAGDFNMDGFDDLAVGVIGEDVSSGAVAVFRGSLAGITTTGATTYRPIQLGSTPESGGAFGWALAAGHMFDTLHEDLAIGAPLRMAAGMNDAGQVYVMKGSATGLTTTGALIYSEDLIGFVAETGARFGQALAVGAISEAPGTPQLVVGSPGYDGGAIDVGQVFVISDFIPPFAQVNVDHLVQGFSGAETGENGDQFGYSLAVADFDQNGRDDLAVGTPFENLENNPATGVNTTNAGQVILYLGAFIFPGPGPATVLHARTLNDTIQTSADLGTAIAFGRFDDSGRPNLAIGAPGMDDRNYRTGAMISNSGQVYVYAPWRQLQNRPHRSSVALDCNARIVYAQRPFHAVPPASTTKAMTVLLAVEEIQASDVDSNYVYTVPEWVANSNKVSGSQAGLVEGEQIRFVDLMKLAISLSAGDACYAIGDILTGGGHVWNGLEGTIPEFADGMNLRAQQLGMLQTNFTNPSGRPLVNHFTTAYDFAQLSRQAMTNPLYRYFVGTTVWPDIPNKPVTNYGWLQGMKALFTDCNGVKPGGNGLSLKTGLSAAADPDGSGRIAAAAFGVPATKYGSPVNDSESGTGKDLLALAASDCPPGFAPTPPEPPSPEPWTVKTNIPTGDPDPPTCAQVFLDDRSPGEDAVIEVRPQDVPGADALFEVLVSRSSELYIEPGDEVIVAFEHGEAHRGFVIGNLWSTPANLAITLSEPVGTTNLVLAPESEHVVAADPSIADHFEIRIRNSSSSGLAWLRFEEVGYENDGEASGRAFTSMTLGRPAALYDEVVQVCVDGRDVTPGNLVALVIRPGSGIVSADPLPPVAAESGIALLPSRPNPFRGSTTLAFRLDQAGPVWLTVHDVSGRQVRALLRGETHEPGAHTRVWDGLDDEGRPAATGIYFVRLRVPDGMRTAQAVRLSD
jgi:hypothetical protein